MDLKEDEVKEVISDEAVPESAPATFKGRINLAKYTHSPSVNVPSRRSTRSTPLIATASPTQDSLILDPKRKRKANDTHLSASPSGKKSRSPSTYAPPSTYAHLPLLPDVLAPNLVLVFIGLNPGITTSTTGHAYAHPSNLFWKLLHSSGITTRRLAPSEDGTLPARFQCGYTNIVPRPTRNGGELKKKEMDEQVSVLEEKVAKFRPEAVCLVGKGIWDSVARVKGWGKGKTFEYGWQEGIMMGMIEGASGEQGEEAGNWEGARVFVATSTSGLAATVRPEEKEKIWRVLGSWVEERRSVRTDQPNQQGVEIDEEE